MIQGPTPLSYVQFCVMRTREENRHRRAMEKLKRRLQIFQVMCKHEKTRFQADPAGGSDSCYICLNCDKEL